MGPKPVIATVAPARSQTCDAWTDVRSELDHVRSRHFYELRKGSVIVQTEDLGASADVSLTRTALRTLAADDVHLGRDVVADAHVLAAGAFAESFHESAEFVTVNARKMHRLADRGIPVVDVFVR